MNNFFINLKTIPAEYLIESINNNPFKGGEIWEITNEIKPIDLYCYLFAKFGPPNGILTFFKNDHSDNLIHWDWILESTLGIINIQGHNFRTEIHVSQQIVQNSININDFISQIKSDFKNHGKEISETKKSLEKWIEFVNPFTRIQDTIRLLFGKLEDLNLNIEEEKNDYSIHNINKNNSEEFKKLWSERTEKYNFAIGLVYGLRSMLPVMAESFINLLIFILCKPEIKNNERLFQSFLRNQIDIRIQSLHLYCEGFIDNIDYNSVECRKFHTLINERNDLLHGNININRQAFNKVYFDRKTPIFDEYQDFWEKSIGISINSVKLQTIYDDMLVIEDFIGYVSSKLDNAIRFQIEDLMTQSRLGFNEKTGRVGILFPKHLVDFKAVFGGKKL